MISFCGNIYQEIYMFFDFLKGGIYMKRALKLAGFFAILLAIFWLLYFLKNGYVPAIPLQIENPFSGKILFSMENVFISRWWDLLLCLPIGGAISYLISLYQDEKFFFVFGIKVFPSHVCPLRNLSFLVSLAFLFFHFSYDPEEFTLLDTSMATGFFLLLLFLVEWIFYIYVSRGEEKYKKPAESIGETIFIHGLFILLFFAIASSFFGIVLVGVAKALFTIIVGFILSTLCFSLLWIFVLAVVIGATALMPYFSSFCRFLTKP